MLTKQVKTVPASGTEVFIPLSKLKKSPKKCTQDAAQRGGHRDLCGEHCRQGHFAKSGRRTRVRRGRDRHGILLRDHRRRTAACPASAGEAEGDQEDRADPLHCRHRQRSARNQPGRKRHPRGHASRRPVRGVKRLADERGFGAEEIAARFGVTAQVVRQRRRLGAVSPKLMQVYRDGDLTLEQLSAFAITGDHARQEAVYERLSYNRDASTIRRLLTETHVPATDRRARFVGIETYTEAGGTILRDLFTEDRGGYFEDVALFDLLVTGKLGRAADGVREAEGWKWTEPHLDFPHAHGMRRTYPHPVELLAEDRAALETVQIEFDRLTQQYRTAEELPDDVDARFGELEAEIERLESKRQAYDPDDVARGGAFVILNHDGTPRIPRETNKQSIAVLRCASGQTAAGRSLPGPRTAIEAAMGAVRATNGDHHGYHRHLHRFGQRLRRLDQDVDAQHQGKARRVRAREREGTRFPDLRRCHRLCVARDYAESLACSRGFLPVLAVCASHNPMELLLAAHCLS